MLVFRVCLFFMSFLLSQSVFEFFIPFYFTFTSVWYLNSGQLFSPFLWAINKSWLGITFFLPWSPLFQIFLCVVWLQKLMQLSLMELCRAKKECPQRRHRPRHWEYVTHLNNMSHISETILKSVTKLFCSPVLMFFKSVIEDKERPDHAHFLVRISQTQQKWWSHASWGARAAQRALT